LPGELQAAPKHITHLLVNQQAGPEQLQGALGKGFVLYGDAQGYLPPDVKICPQLGFLIAHLIVAL
jgi:hypothetical protein